MTITHLKDRQRFTLKTEETESFLTYQLENSSMDIDHTYVSPKHRGQGIAERLVLEALNYAKENNLKVIPTCTYVAGYIERHPEWKKQTK